MNNELFLNFENDWNGNIAIEALDRLMGYCLFYNDNEELFNFANLIVEEVNSEELYNEVIKYNKNEVIEYIKESGIENDIDIDIVDEMLELYYGAFDIVTDEHDKL